MYACETWSIYADAADVCYRMGLKTALSIRQNVLNEIIHIETGTSPLQCKVKRHNLNGGPQ